MPGNPLLIYLDANVLFYWMLPGSHSPDAHSRHWHAQCHQEMEDLVGVLNNYRGSDNRVTVIISQWSLTETHSVLYQDVLWNTPGVVPRHLRKDPRKRFPPHAPCLQQATTFLEQRMNDLVSRVSLQIDQPGFEVWATALQISEEGGIYAPDCLHLATALHRGCELLVTQDTGFLNSIYYLEQSGLLAGILGGLHGAGPPAPFEAAPILPHRKINKAGVLTTRQWLAGQGYT